MLAYRHIFHAGNFADVFKHATVVQLAILISRKDKPFLYLDTHAGIGRYDLSHAWAQKNKEFERGIGRIFDRNDCPETVRPYLDSVRKCNPDGKLRFYPGSPLLVHQLMRDSDQMVLVDLGKEDHGHLQRQFEGVRRVQIRNMDGYQALKAYLPPKERRALVLVDSPFDRKDEFRRLSGALADAHRRFSTGVYAAWYPLMDAKSVAGFEQSVLAQGIRRVLKLELSVCSATPQHGLCGSAMLVINPPYGFDSLAAPMLHWLWTALSTDREGRYSVKWLVGE